MTEDGQINTIVTITRERNFTRSGPEVADEVKYISRRIENDQLHNFTYTLDIVIVSIL